MSSERRKIQLEIEREALKKESRSGVSRERLERLRSELADLKERADVLRAQWQAEKEASNKVQVIKAEIEATKAPDRTSRSATPIWQKAAELKYGT